MVVINGQTIHPGMNLTDKNFSNLDGVSIDVSIGCKY